MIFTNLRRPQLNSFSLKKTTENIPNGYFNLFITMSIGQWDVFLNEAYYRQGAILIELDKKGQLIAAYKYVT